MEKKEEFASYVTGVSKDYKNSHKHEELKTLLVDIARSDIDIRNVP